MGDCSTPTECSLLMYVLGAQCTGCFRRDPDVVAKLALHRAKAEARPTMMQPRRHKVARGLHDAQRVRTVAKGTGRGRTPS